jgi:hypothetical protein
MSHTKSIILGFFKRFIASLLSASALLNEAHSGKVPPTYRTILNPGQYGIAK